MRHALEFLLLTVPRAAFAWSPTLSVLWVVAFAACMGGWAYAGKADPVDPPRSCATQYVVRWEAIDDRMHSQLAPLDTIDDLAQREANLPAMRAITDEATRQERAAWADLIDCRRFRSPLEGTQSTLGAIP